MSTRQTHTEKWDDLWFKRRTSIEKLLFIYLCDKCDIAGFWEIDLEGAAQALKCNIETVEMAFNNIDKAYFKNERFLVLKTFIYYQGNLPLNQNNNCHKGILRRLGQHPDLWERIKEYWHEKKWVIINQKSRTLWTSPTAGL
jgi:hypothetical protein